MTKTANEILIKALSLDPMERAELIENLFRSFDKEEDNRINVLWAEEAESRIDAFEAGKLSADSADAVFKRISQK